jgi:DinB family protein
VNDEELKRAIGTLRRMPESLTAATRGVTRADAAIRPSPVAFSIVENVAHLHDIEREGYLVRIRRLLEEERPDLPDIDGERLAIERRYNERELEGEIRAFGAARLETVALLERTPASRLSREGRLEGVGTVSLGRLIEMMVEHDRGHLSDIERLLEDAARPAEG